MRASRRATRTPACKEYDALKAKLGRGEGPASSVGVSGELFVTKEFGQMNRLFFFGDFLFEPAKRKLPARRGGTRQQRRHGKETPALRHSHVPHECRTLH